MKHYKIFLSLTLLFLAVPYFAMTGCFSRTDIKFKIVETPNLKCLETNITKTCLGGIELEIKNNCDKVFIYKDKNGRQIGIGKTISDPDIPQDYVSWKRELYYGNNDKVTISVENLKVGVVIASFVKNASFFILVLIALLAVSAGIANIVKFNLKKNKKNKK